MLKQALKASLLAAALSIAALSVSAQEQPAADASQQDAAKQAEALVGSLHFRDGEIAVPEAGAHFKLGQEFRYLDKPDARKVLEQLWGNPPDDSILGLVVPTAAPLTSEESWAVVVTYSDEGHVSDEDAAKTDYNALLSQMKQEVKDENPERKRAGYGGLDLIGWAVPPRYDSDSKKLYWAREVAFEGQQQHTLNYDIRVLGRGGYLSLNAVSNMSELGAVQNGMQQLLPMTEFDSGKRYADYNSSTDKLAGYGIAALIGGGIAAKTGLLAKLGVLLLAAKKFVVLAFAGLVAFVRKLFGGKDKSNRTVQ